MEAVRHNVAQMSIAGEEGDVCQETFESCREWVKELISGFEPADIWNQDETGTKRKALPEKSLGERGKHCKGGNDAKQRIIAGFFVIATCGKETPILIIIGSGDKPCCFANLRDISCPCGADNFSNDKSWMKS